MHFESLPANGIAQRKSCEATTTTVLWIEQHKIRSPVGIAADISYTQVTRISAALRIQGHRLQQVARLYFELLLLQSALLKEKTQKTVLRLPYNIDSY